MKDFYLFIQVTSWYKAVSHNKLNTGSKNDD